MHHNLETTTAGPPGTYWAPVVAYAGLIFFVSGLSHPEESFPSLLEGVSDKFFHIIEYAVLGALCDRAFRHGAGAWATRYALGWAIMASTGYGVTDELHQALVPDRTFEGLDIIADFVGSTVGAFGWRWMATCKQRCGEPARGGQSTHSTVPRQKEQESRFQ